MAGSFADYFENKVLDKYFGAVEYTPPANLYIALSTADPTDDGSGLTEPSGGAYERKLIANNKTTWTTASAGALDNAIEIAFAMATASWGVITHFAIMDALTGGNMIGHADLLESKTVGNGDTVKFAIGDLDITLD